MNNFKYFLVFLTTFESSQINNELWKVFVPSRERKVSVNLTLISIAVGNETYTNKQSPGDRLPSGRLLENIFLATCYILQNNHHYFKWEYFMFEVIF